MMLWVVLMMSAHASPELGAAVVGLMRSDGPAGGGARVTVGFPARAAWAVEGQVDAGATTAGGFAAARIAGRLFAQRTEIGGLGLWLGAGAMMDERGVDPRLTIGFTGVPAGRGRARIRFDAGGELGLTGLDAMHFGVGGVLWARDGERPPRREREPKSEPIVEPESEPVIAQVATDLPQITVEPEGALVWIPHPVCAWAPASEAGALLAEYGGEQPVQVRAPGYLPGTVDPSGGEVTLEPAPEQGAIVVVGWPGDVLNVDGVVVSTDQDGVVVTSAPPGPVLLDVVGYGRVAQVDAYVGDGMALWVRVPPPQPIQVLFGSGSSSVSGSTIGQIESIAEALGDGHVVLRGGSSPEGNAEVNARLGRMRAEAVRDALIAAGAPEEQVHLGESEIADGPPGPQQRRVTLTPLRSAP